MRFVPGPYRERYQAGAEVRVVSAAKLRAFQKHWKSHHPVQAEHLRFAGLRTTIQSVGFYQNGDALYRLAGVPGLYWHETCLEPEG